MAEIKEFGGLDNQNAETDYGLKRLSVARNVDITRNGKIKRRPGRTKIAEALADAAWAGRNSLLYQAGSNLYHITQAGAGVLVASGLMQTNWLSGDEINNQIFWTNGYDSGVIEHGVNRGIGLEAPELPLYVRVPGMMPAGRYMFTMTHVRDDGLESGAPMAGLVELSANSGMRFVFTLPDGVASARIYLTNCNGSQLYQAGEGASPIVYRGDTLDLVQPLLLQFCDKPPRAEHIAYFKSAMFYAQGNILWSTPPFHYQVVDYREDYVVFPDDIQMVAPLESGLIVATTQETIWLQGTNINAMTATVMLPYGAVRGTMTRTLARHIQAGRSGEAAIWATTRGAVVAFGDGSLIDLTTGQFHYPMATVGCGFVRESGGQEHFIVSVRGDGYTYNARHSNILGRVIQPIPEATGET